MLQRGTGAGHTEFLIFFSVFYQPSYPSRVSAPLYSVPSGGEMVSLCRRDTTNPQRGALASGPSCPLGAIRTLAHLAACTHKCPPPCGYICLILGPDEFARRQTAAVVAGAIEPARPPCYPYRAPSSAPPVAKTHLRPQLDSIRQLWASDRARSIWTRVYRSPSHRTVPKHPPLPAHIPC